jgi:hypothetical protein
MKYARIVLIGLTVFSTTGGFRFSIRWSDLFCHRSLRAFAICGRKIPGVILTLLNTLLNLLFYKLDTVNAA